MQSTSDEMGFLDLWKRLVRQARFRSATQADAEDSASETVVRILQRYQSKGPDAITNLGAFAAVDCYYRLRANWKKQNRQSSIANEAEFAECAYTETVQEQIDSADLLAHVRDFNQQTASVLELRHRQDCKVKEIAALLGMSEAMVKKTLHQYRHEVGPALHQRRIVVMQIIRRFISEMRRVSEEPYDPFLILDCDGTRTDFELWSSPRFDGILRVCGEYVQAFTAWNEHQRSRHHPPVLRVFLIDLSRLHNNLEQAMRNLEIALNKHLQHGLHAGFLFVEDLPSGINLKTNQANLGDRVFCDLGNRVPMGVADPDLIAVFAGRNDSRGVPICEATDYLMTSKNLSCVISHANDITHALKHVRDKAKAWLPVPS